MKSKEIVFKIKNEFTLIAPKMLCNSSTTYFDLYLRSKIILNNTVFIILYTKLITHLLVI